MRLPLRLIWSPFSLADTAWSCSDGFAILVGGFSAGGVVALGFGGQFRGLGEPYQTYNGYLIESVFAMLLMGGLSFLVTSLGMVLLFGIISVATSKVSTTSRRIMRAAFLVPVPLLLPLAAWIPLSILGGVNDHGMDINSGVPLALKGWFFKAAAWRGWPMAVALVGALAVWLYAVTELRRRSAYAACDCGYDRSGLAADAACPECGDTTTPSSLPSK